MEKRDAELPVFLKRISPEWKWPLGLQASLVFMKDIQTLVKCSCTRNAWSSQSRGAERRKAWGLTRISSPGVKAAVKENERLKRVCYVAVLHPLERC